MRIEPKLLEVVNGKRGMLRGIRVALEAECLVSAVGLMFAAIDALAALSRPVGQRSTGRKTFIDWAERYLKPAETLGCSPVDLYAARCGVLHTYSSDAELVANGKARQLIYRWQAGPAADASLPLPKGAMMIEVEALFAAIRDGVRQFLIDSEMDPGTKARVSRHLPTLLCYAPWPKLQVEVAA